MTQLDDQPASHKFSHSFSSPFHRHTLPPPFVAADCTLSHNCVSGYVFIILLFVYLIFFSSFLLPLYRHILAVLYIMCSSLTLESTHSSWVGNNSIILCACFQLILNSNSLIFAITVWINRELHAGWWRLGFFAFVIKFTSSLMWLYINNTPHC